MRKRHSTDGCIFALWQFPIGWLGVVAGEQGLVSIVSHPDPQEVRRRIEATWPEAVEKREGPVDAALKQLAAYFAGERKQFDLPLDFQGLPPFTAEVLQSLALMPFGERITYGRMAARVGRPRAARAVGRAMAGNPFPIVVPCHRVVGADGALTGYSGGEGIATKEWLLRFEEKRIGRGNEAVPLRSAFPQTRSTSSLQEGKIMAFFKKKTLTGLSRTCG